MTPVRAAADRSAMDAGRAARAVPVRLSGGWEPDPPPIKHSELPRTGLCGERLSPSPGKGVSLASLR